MARGDWRILQRYLAELPCDDGCLSE